MAALADQVRRLIELTVTCDVPSEAAATLGAELRSLNDRLATHRADPLHPRFVPPPDLEASSHPGLDSPEAQGPPGGPLTLLDAMPYDVVVGRYNPLALPLAIELVPPKALGRARFTPAYEGAPGWVHGAVIAGAFDIMLTAANHLEGAAGPTTRLEVHYRRPTLLDEEAHFEAWVDRRRGRRVVSKGLLLQQGSVRVEAEGEFVTVDRRRLLFDA